MIEKSSAELISELGDMLTNHSVPKLQSMLIDVNDIYSEIVIKVETDIDSPLLWLRDLSNHIALIIEQKMEEKNEQRQHSSKVPRIPRTRHSKNKETAPVLD